MKKAIIIVVLILVLVICVGAGYKLDLYNFLNNYEEECYMYDTYEKRVCSGFLANSTLNNKTKEICWSGLYGSGWRTTTEYGSGWRTTTEFNFSKCIKYHLVRKINN